MNDDLQNSEGLPAKQLQGNVNFSKEINTADVAELVDARDLKVLATTETSSLSCKTSEIEPAETALNPAPLQNKKPRKDAHAERREREAWALAVVKGIRRSPSAPEPTPEPFRPTHLPGAPDALGVVYFVYCAGRIKIGYSTDMPNRMGGLATHGPLPVTLLLTIGGSPEDEDAYHEMFREDRRNLEWFHLSWALREFLDEHCNEDGFHILFDAEVEFYEAMKESLAYISEVMEEVEQYQNESASC